jgi:replicative DNA helicase
LEGIGDVSSANCQSERIDTQAHVVYGIWRLRDLEFVRHGIEFSRKHIACAYEENKSLDGFIVQARNELLAISDACLINGAVHVSKAINSAIIKRQIMLHKRIEITGATLDFTDLEKMRFGFRESAMIATTALTIHIAKNVVWPEKRIARPSERCSLALN